MRQMLYGLPRYGKSHEVKYEFKDVTLRATLSRLRKLGLVSNKQGEWAITVRGKQHLKNRKSRFAKGHGKYPASSAMKHKKNMIIAFDIPESHKKMRDWLRVELRLLGFEPIQKSVWFGPAPLPEDFLESLSELNLLPFLKFFRTTEEELV